MDQFYSGTLITSWVITTVIHASYPQILLRVLSVLRVINQLMPAAAAAATTAAAGLDNVAGFRLVAEIQR